MSRTIATILSLRDQFTGPAKKATESTKNLSRELKITQNQVSKIGKSIVKVAKVGAVGLVGLGVASAKMGMEFSNSIAKVSTIADSNVKSMTDMRKEILNLSNQTGASANALAEDVYNAISAGVDTSNAVNVVATTTKLAKAGFAETGASLDLLTTIVNGYGKSIEEADYISDILINTQNRGKVTVGELSASMGKIIPTANATNVSLEQVASGYAIMTANGIKSAEATTYMNSMINELSKSGTKASKTLIRQTGKSFAELMEEGKTLSDVLQIMNEAAEEGGLALNDMFGSAEAGKAGLVLSKNAGKDFNDMVQDMRKSAGATQEAFDKLDVEPIEKFNKSINRLKNKGIELGIALLPIANNIADGFLKITEIPIGPYLDIGIEKAKATVGFFKDNWGTIGPLVLTVVSAYTLYKTIMVAQLAYTKAVIIAEGIKTAVMATGATTVNAITIAQWAWNAAMTANPIGMVIAGIAGLVAGGILIWKNWDIITEKTTKMWEWIKNLGSSALQLGIDLLAPLNPINKIIEGFEKVKNVGSNAMSSVKGFFGFGDKTEAKTPAMAQYAKGGIATKPSIFGEAGPEIAIPLNNSNRSKELLAQANSIINKDVETKTISNNNSKSTSNSKNITININGDIYGFDDFKEKIAKALVEIVGTGANMVVVE